MVQVLEPRRLLTAPEGGDDFTDEDRDQAAEDAAEAQAAFEQSVSDAQAEADAATGRINTAAQQAEQQAAAVIDAAAATFQSEVAVLDADHATAMADANSKYASAEAQADSTFQQELDSSAQQRQAADAASQQQYGDELQAADNDYQTDVEQANDDFAAANAAISAAHKASEEAVETAYDTSVTSIDQSYQTQSAALLAAYDGAIEAADQVRTSALGAAQADQAAAVAAAAATRDAALAPYSSVSYDPSSVDDDPAVLAAIASAEAALATATALAQDVYETTVLQAFDAYQSSMASANASRASAMVAANDAKTLAYLNADAAFADAQQQAQSKFTTAAAQAATDKTAAYSKAKDEYNSKDAGLRNTRDTALQQSVTDYQTAVAGAQQTYDTSVASDAQSFGDESAKAYQAFLTATDTALGAYDKSTNDATSAFSSQVEGDMTTYKGEKQKAWDAYQQAQSAYNNSLSQWWSGLEWTAKISAAEAQWYGGMISDVELWEVYKAYAVDQAKSHVNTVGKIKELNLEYQSAERDAATTLAIATASPSYDLAVAAADATEALAKAKLTDTSAYDTAATGWDAERMISEAYLWAELEVAVAKAEKAKLDAEIQANLTYSLAEIDIELVYTKAAIAADAQYNTTMAQANAEEARAIANADRTQTLAYAAAERSYYSATIAADESHATASNGAMAALSQAVIQATLPYAAAITSAYAFAQSTVINARASAIIDASNGDPDVIVVASEWANYEIAAVNAQVLQIMATVGADVVFNLAENAAWLSAANQDVSNQAARANASADASLQWAQDLADADLQADLASIDAAVARSDSQTAAEKRKAEQQAAADAGQDRRVTQNSADQELLDAQSALNRTISEVNNERDRDEASVNAEKNRVLGEIASSVTSGNEIIQAEKDKELQNAATRRDEVAGMANKDKEVALADLTRYYAAEYAGAQQMLASIRASDPANFAGNPGPGIGASLTWLYNDGLDQAVNFTAGWMDGLSMGGWSYVGQGTYLTQYVDYQSGAYLGGQIVGTVHASVICFAAAPCAPGVAGSIARTYNTITTGVGLIEAAYNVSQGQVGITEILTLAPMGGRLGGRLAGFNCFVAGTPVAVGWQEEPVMASMECSSSDSDGTESATVSWLVVGATVIIAGVHVSQRLRRREEEEMANPPPRPIPEFDDDRLPEQESDDSGQLVNACEPPVVLLDQDFGKSDTPSMSVTAFHTIPVGSHTTPLAFTIPLPRTDAKCETNHLVPAFSVPLPPLLPRFEHIASPRVPQAPRRRRILTRVASTAALLLGFIVGGLCFWHSGMAARGSSVASASVRSAASAATPVSRQHMLQTIPIEQIRPGMRVLADDPEQSDLAPVSVIDPAETCLVQLTQQKVDGSAVEITTLVDRTELWKLALERLACGDAVSLDRFSGAANNYILSDLLNGAKLDLELPEFGVQGPAALLSVEPLSAIDSTNDPARRLVTSTFRHVSANVASLRLVGNKSPLGVTDNHPFWSEDRQAFIPASELRIGERLKNADGSVATVAELDRLPGRYTVYNFEVEGEHVYFVGEDGTLVHNTCVYREIVGGVHRYIGITNNFGRRAGEHLRIGRHVTPIAGLTDITRRQARAIEQLLIEKLGRAGIDSGGTLSNINCGIDPRRLGEYADELDWARSILPTLGF